MPLEGLATLQSIGKIGILEIQVRAGIAGLRTKYVGQANRISTQVGFYGTVLSQNSFCSEKLHYSLLRPSTGWRGPL